MGMASVWWRVASAAIGLPLILLGGFRVALEIAGYTTTLEQLQAPSERVRIVHAFLAVPVPLLVIVLVAGIVLVAWPLLSVISWQYPRPRFRGRIEAVELIGSAHSTSGSGNASCLVRLYVSNIGTDSTISEWRGSIRGTRAKRLTYACSLLPNNLIVTEWSGKLVDDVAHEAIKNGESVTVLLGISAPERPFNLDVSTLTLNFQDVQGHEYTVKATPEVKITNFG
jgi:hypothetical protein